jgi:Glycosyl hydrolase family 26
MRRFAVRRFALVVIVAGVIVLANSAVNASASPLFAAEAGPAAPVLFGAYTPPAPESGMEKTFDLERQLNRRVDIVSWYQHWGGWGIDFNAAWVAAAAAGGRTPMITWEPWAPGLADQPAYRLAQVARGAFDSYILTWATSLKSYGRPVYLRPMHEMNGNWYPWGGTVNANSAADYIAAWRHMHDMFRAAGATNVRWVWSPLVDDTPNTKQNALERYYPGKRYVDVLALDGYNWGADAPEYGGWRTFDQVFAHAYARISRLGPQPIWIAETGTSAIGGDKAGWVRDMFAAAPSYARLEAIVWFNQWKERDWRATSSPEVAAAFAAPAA